MHISLITFSHSVVDDVTVAETGDQFSIRIFYEAGNFLAKHIIGLLPRVDKVGDSKALDRLHLYLVPRVYLDANR